MSIYTKQFTRERAETLAAMLANDVATPEHEAARTGKAVSQMVKRFESMVKLGWIEQVYAWQSASDPKSRYTLTLDGIAMARHQRDRGETEPKAARQPRQTKADREAEERRREREEAREWFNGSARQAEQDRANREAREEQARRDRDAYRKAAEGFNRAAYGFGASSAPVDPAAATRAIWTRAINAVQWTDARIFRKMSAVLAMHDRPGSDGEKVNAAMILNKFAGLVG